MKQYKDTNISNEILKVMTEKLKYGWDTSLSDDSVKMLVEGMAKYLGEVKEKGKVHAAIIEDIKGNFHLGAFVEFIKGDSAGEDSYTLTYTFNENDIKEDFVKANLSDPVFHCIIADIGLTKYGMSFRSIEGKEFIAPTMCVVADCIKNYLHANVALDPVVELDKYFTAKAELDGDKVYYTLTPWEILKQHIKADAENEKQIA